MSDLAFLIRRRRQQLGLTQLELARRVGWHSGQFVSNIERRVCLVPVASVGKLAQALQVDIKLLIKNLADEKIKKITHSFGSLDE